MAIINKYESSNGDDFRTFDDWLRTTLFEEYEKFKDTVTFPSPEYQTYYENWIKSEKITKHTVLEDGVEVSVTYYPVE
jgi:hypothetical protein